MGRMGGGCTRLRSLALCDWKLSPALLTAIGSHRSMRKLILRNASNVSVVQVLRSLSAGSSSVESLDVVGLPFGPFDGSENLSTRVRELSIGCASEKSAHSLVRLLESFTALRKVAIWFRNPESGDELSSWVKKSTATVAIAAQ